MDQNELAMNGCDVEFFCNHGVLSPCVYKAGNNRICKYSDGMICKSSIARTNAIATQQKGIVDLITTANRVRNMDIEKKKKVGLFSRLAKWFFL